MQLKKEETVLREIIEFIASCVNTTRRELDGQTQFWTLSRSEDDRMHSSVFWILSAQIGTLRKIQSFFPAERKLGPIELLATARNLFENLVWLRLFNVDPQFGLVLYTSRLLHSTPMNLVTETGLSESERIMMLEYCYVTIHDLVEEIEKFSFPGKVTVICVDEVSDNTH